MSQLANTARSIEARFGAAFPDLPTQFGQDGSFTPPSDGQWVRLTILEGEPAYRTLGGSLIDAQGLAVVDIFSPASAGKDAGRELGDRVVASFHGLRADGISYGTRQTPVHGRSVPYSEASGLDHFKVLIPYHLLEAR